ncbi:MAG: N-acetylglucosamine-6-phosphate deacetylase [Lactobacillales bacterium]|jgi:N-acetylglucosamine-6-phosphate deacetylase|nr:N-acetylglucosamine-6-phosphate deacetylase [Lactobacillales bacterium]
MKKYVLADRFFYANSTKARGYLELNQGCFGQFYEKLQDSSAEVIDYSGKWIAPGLVDTHIHGFFGVDVMDNDWQGVTQTMSEGLLSCGVTSFLPTTLTAPRDVLKEICQGIGGHYKEARGAKIQGIYFEGPYFTEEHKGAQNPSYMRLPDASEFQEWQEVSGGIIVKIGVAPELNGICDFIRTVSESGVVVALGHSNATFAQANCAVNSGANVWVHAYNGMRGFAHREPGMVGAVMTQKDTYAELICDGYHVHPSAAKILMDVVDRDHVVLITDCMRAGGMMDGEYTLGEFKVMVKDGAARLSSGNLAGSVLLLKDAMKNVVDWGIATPEVAVRMASLIPARSCKIEDVCGKIMEGRSADFLVLNQDMSLVATYLDGELRYENKSQIVK